MTGGWIAMPAPEVSVVIATHNRAWRLKAVLETLREQTIGCERFEVIVVDDVSTDETAAMLAEESGRNGLRLRPIRREEQGGPGQARNTGWRAAGGRLVAFTDDDCLADPRWVEEGLAAWAGRPDVFVQGVTAPIEEELGNLWPLGYTNDISEPSPQYETCNIFYPRELLERLGGFDEMFRRAAEDVDLGWRARAAGARPVFCPEARVRHAVVALDRRNHLRRARLWPEAVPALARHRGFRRERLIWGVFWHHSHFLLLRALLGLPFIRWQWSWALAWWLLRPFFDYELLRARRGGSLRLAPYWMFHDLVETAGMVRAGVRHRVLVI